mgnify:CR=1 FL=1
MKKRRLYTAALLLLILACTMLTGCFGSESEPEADPNQSGARTQDEAAKPEIPDKLAVQDGVPQLVVYDVSQNLYQQMDIEDYLAGVLAGEMRNDWPMEALKAQAILARTYALKFAGEKQSQYGGADISTDVQEAQAYDAGKVNDRVRKAIEETRGLVMSHEGELPFAWFHAHAGGVTELAVAGLDYKEEEPPYTQSVESPDSPRAPSGVKEWTAEFTAKEVGKAAADAGVRTGDVTTIEVGDKSGSGRAVNFVVNGKTVSAPALRIALGASKIKSTLVKDVSVKGDTITFTGSGYGHGVGMSQWGAYGMAEDGKNAEEIVKHYFKDVSVVSLWD